MFDKNDIFGDIQSSRRKIKTFVYFLYRRVSQNQGRESSILTLNLRLSIKHKKTQKIREWDSQTRGVGSTTSHNFFGRKAWVTSKVIYF